MSILDSFSVKNDEVSTKILIGFHSMESVLLTLTIALPEGKKGKWIPDCNLYSSQEQILVNFLIVCNIVEFED